VLCSSVIRKKKSAAVEIKARFSWLRRSVAFRLGKRRTGFQYGGSGFKAAVRRAAAPTGSINHCCADQTALVRNAAIEGMIIACCAGNAIGYWIERGFQLRSTFFGACYK